MKKVFISMPMNGFTESEIREKLKEQQQVVRDITQLGGLEFIDTFIEEAAPFGTSVLWYLGESIKRLSEANIAYFAPGWKDARGCVIEHECASKYGIHIIEADE